MDSNTLVTIIGICLVYAVAIGGAYLKIKLDDNAQDIRIKNIEEKIKSNEQDFKEYKLEHTTNENILFTKILTKLDEIVKEISDIKIDVGILKSKSNE